MDNNWAVENLQVIRTLMERSALYRRALAPIMLFAGLLGTSAGIAGVLFNVQEPRSFVVLWAIVGLTALAGSFIMVRRQAMKDAEPFWSAPTRHVSQALNPPLVAGAVAGLLVLCAGRRSDSAEWVPVLIPAIWMVLYGCALTSAGFFMRRGIRVLGWIFLLAGLGWFSMLFVGGFYVKPFFGNIVMGLAFGLLHVACGVYLYFTENKRDQA